MFASLVLLMAAAKKKPWKMGTSRGHITNLKQSILETFDIYGKNASHLNKLIEGNTEKLNKIKFQSKNGENKNIV